MRVHHWLPRAVALHIALELGLLSPLCCVIHSVIHRLAAERPAVTIFLCGEHGAKTATPESAAGPPHTSVPRALYQLLSLTPPLLTVASVLVAVIVPRPSRLTPPQPVSPPTPPPRFLAA